MRNEKNILEALRARGANQRPTLTDVNPDFCLLPDIAVKLLHNMLHFYAIADHASEPENLMGLRFLGFMSLREHQDLKWLWDAVEGTSLNLQEGQKVRLMQSQVRGLHEQLLGIYEKKPQLWEHSSYKHFEDVLRVALAEHCGMLVLPHEKKPE